MRKESSHAQPGLSSVERPTIPIPGREKTKDFPEATTVIDLATVLQTPNNRLSEIISSLSLNQLKELISETEERYNAKTEEIKHHASLFEKTGLTAAAQRGLEKVINKENFNLDQNLRKGASAAKDQVEFMDAYTGLRQQHVPLENKIRILKNELYSKKLVENLGVDPDLMLGMEPDEFKSFLEKQSIETFSLVEQWLHKQIINHHKDIKNNDPDHEQKLADFLGLLFKIKPATKQKPTTRRPKRKQTKIKSKAKLPKDFGPVPREPFPEDSIKNTDADSSVKESSDNSQNDTGKTSNIRTGKDEYVENTTLSNKIKNEVTDNTIIRPDFAGTPVGGEIISFKDATEPEHLGSNDAFDKWEKFRKDTVEFSGLEKVSPVELMAETGEHLANYARERFANKPREMYSWLHQSQLEAEEQFRLNNIDQAVYTGFVEASGEAKSIIHADILEKEYPFPLHANEPGADIFAKLTKQYQKSSEIDPPNEVLIREVLPAIEQVFIRRQIDLEEKMTELDEKDKREKKKGFFSKLFSQKKDRSETIALREMYLKMKHDQNLFWNKIQDIKQKTFEKWADTNQRNAA